MSQVSFSARIEEITGSLGGSRFHDSYGGNQLRPRVTPSTSQTNYERLRRGEFSFISALWRSLTTVERQTFLDAAGGLSGALTLFITVNVNLSLLDLPVVSEFTPASTPEAVAIDFVLYTPTQLEFRLTGSVTSVPGDTMLLLYATYEKLPLKIFSNPAQYGPVATFPPGTDLSAPTSFLVPWVTEYGQLTEGKRICIKAVFISTISGLRGAEAISCLNQTIMNFPFRLKTFTVPETTTGTTPEVIMPYTIPANRLTSDGDTIQAKWSTTSPFCVSGVGIAPQLDGNSMGFYSISSALDRDVVVTILRISSTEAQYSTEFLTEGVAGPVFSGIVSPLDFTAAMNINLEITDNCGIGTTAHYGIIDFWPVES